VASGKVAGAELAQRSISTILANQAPNGSFVAAPNFPQYQFAWLRDGSFISEALDVLGESNAAGRFHDWVAALVVGSAAGLERASAAVAAGKTPSPDDYLHCRYRLDGGRGNEDWPTFQLDGPGIWLWSLGVHARHGGPVTSDHLRAANLVAHYLSSLWPCPSYDAWEEFPEHVHTSTLAAILAGLESFHMVAPEAWDRNLASARDAIATFFEESTEPFTKWKGSNEVDGSLVWLSAPYDLVGRCPARFAATLEQIERDLVTPDGGVHRYRSDTYYGGGEWILLAASLGRAYLRRGSAGDVGRAARCLRWIEGQAQPDFTLPEQVSTRALHPECIQEWVDRWGPSARPLLWSHANYLLLRHELMNDR